MIRMIRTFVGWTRRVRGVFSGAGEADVADEVACHLQLHVDDNLRAHHLRRVGAPARLGGQVQRPVVQRDAACSRDRDPMALGAPIVSVIRQVVLEGLKPTLIGLGVGIAGASAVAGVLNTCCSASAFATSRRSERSRCS
jgi:hypothetical protein